MANPSEASCESEGAQMLTILRQMQAQMLSIHGWLETLKRGQDAPESSRATPRDASSSRWADHMEGLDILMYTDPQFDEEEEKENQGTKLFSVSKQTEEYLNHHFSTRVDNATRKRWREKFGSPYLYQAQLVPN